MLRAESININASWDKFCPDILYYVKEVVKSYFQNQVL